MADTPFKIQMNQDGAILKTSSSSDETFIVMPDYIKLEKASYPRMAVNPIEPWTEEDSPPEDYGKNIIDTTFEEQEYYTFYCDSVEWDGKYETINRTGNGSAESPWKNLYHALSMIDKISDRLCCRSLFRILVSGIVRKPSNTIYFSRHCNVLDFSRAVVVEPTSIYAYSGLILNIVVNNVDKVGTSIIEAESLFNISMTGTEPEYDFILRCKAIASVNCSMHLTIGGGCIKDITASYFNLVNTCASNITALDKSEGYVEGSILFDSKLSGLQFKNSYVYRTEIYAYVYDESSFLLCNSCFIYQSFIETDMTPVDYKHMNGVVMAIEPSGSFFCETNINSVFHEAPCYIASSVVVCAVGYYPNGYTILSKCQVAISLSFIPEFREGFFLVCPIVEESTTTVKDCVLIGETTYGDAEAAEAAIRGCI